MPQIDYSLKFPYGKNYDGLDLTHELRLDSLASHYDYSGQLYQDQMKWGHASLFREIKGFKQVSIYTQVPPPPNFLSVFSSAIADKRIIPYAYIYASEGKVVVESLILEYFRVTQYRPVNLHLPGGDLSPLAVWIMLMAKDVK